MRDKLYAPSYMCHIYHWVVRFRCPKDGDWRSLMYSQMLDKEGDLTDHQFAELEQTAIEAIIRKYVDEYYRGEQLCFTSGGVRRPMSPDGGTERTG